MPKWRQRFYTIAGGFMCLLFAGFAFLAARPLLRPEANGPQRGLLIASSVYLAVALLSIGVQIWFHRRIISEFHFDGRSLRFRTLGISSMETRDVSEIARIRDWRGRSGALGYRLFFRDGGKAYLEYSVSNAIAVVEQQRSHLPEAS